MTVQLYKKTPHLINTHPDSGNCSSH